MATKTNTAKAAKPARAPKASKKTTTNAADVAAPVAGECPRGGAHEWNEDGSCSNCLEPKQAKGKRAPNTDAEKPAAPPKRMSAIDAALKVLHESGEPMNAKQMIEAMATKGYWTSPGGATPHATLYAAIVREIRTKGTDARFTKTERGLFAANA